MSDIATRSSSVHPAIQDHYSGMNHALYERDELRNKANDLTNQLSIAKGMIDHLQNENNRVTKERDHYMRYSFALSTRINAMQDIMNGIMDLAEHEAENPSPKQLPSAANIEEIVKPSTGWPKNEQD